LDLDRGALLRGGEEVPLRPKPFEVLVYLVERHGRLVTKAQLTEAVWPDTAVMDNSLAQCLVDVRRALGDESQQVIRTVPRRGYIFTAPVTTPVIEFPHQPTANLSEPQPGRVRNIALAGFAVIAIVATALWWTSRLKPARLELDYMQLTNFTDSAVSPALSPDGKMLAFIRGDNWFLTPDQIYVKLLPDGEPVQITHDPRAKYGPVFSPDGSRIVYTVAPWSTYAVSPLGGEPALFLNNSSGVTWLDRHRILFSEVNPPNTVHMGVVTAKEDRSEQRAVYFPQDARGMVHLSYPSPDHKWVLVLEMNPVWQPCRVVPMDGSSDGHQVGPKGNCTSAAWSPDGKWMFFGVQVEGSHHLWRQQFPDGQPEQITNGPTEEDGIAVAPDGRSLITSIGTRQSAVWIHDARGDRPLSSQGEVPHYETTPRFGSIPVFTQDGKWLFYQKSELRGTSTELWRADLSSEKSERVLPGISMLEFDISDDAKEVVYTTQPSGKPLQLWISSLDRRSGPRLIASFGEDSPHFGPDGRIITRRFDGTNYYLSQINRDGSGHTDAVPYPVGSIGTMSPDRRWISTSGTIPNVGAGTFAVPLSGGAPQRICWGCPAVWAPDGRFLYLFTQPPSRTDPGTTWVIPTAAREMLPKLPPQGIRSLADVKLIPGVHSMNAYAFFPGPEPSTYAYVKNTMHRNLFRIPLR
jgi:DNA-binding winged helix-turn-helix (wHTH) protein/Tol biopolymer transport system component